MITDKPTEPHGDPTTAWCESCLADLDGPHYIEATTHSTNPDWSGYDLCADCAARYDATPKVDG